MRYLQQTQYDYLEETLVLLLSLLPLLGYPTVTFHIMLESLHDPLWDILLERN